MRRHSLLLPIMLGALSGLTPLAIDMYLPAIPTIARDLGSSVELVQLTVSTFLGGFALGQLFYGPLADSLGRKPVLLFGIGLFMLASIGCAFAPSLPWLLACRLLQALGGAAGAVVVNALLRALFSGEEMVRVMTVVVLTMTLAPLLAPVLGGALLIWHWSVIFLVLALLATLLWFTMLLTLPETLPTERRQPLRWRSVLGNYAKVLTHGRAMGSLLSGTLASAGMFAFISGSPYVYIDYFGVPAHHYGWLFGLNVLLLMSMTWLNGRLVKKVGILPMLRLALLFAGLASGLLLLSGTTGWGGLWGVVVPVVLYIGPMGVVGTNTTSHLLGFFPENAGTAAALAGSFRFAGGALAGMAVNALPATSPLPMTAVMACCGLSALICYTLLVHRNPHHSR